MLFFERSTQKHGNFADKIVMRILLVTLFLLSCVPEQRTTGSINALAPSRWNPALLPLKVKVSDEFNVLEEQHVSDAANSWDASVNYQANFFDTSETASVSEYANLNSYLDDEMGIYKSSNWHSELPLSALAITQIFGYRKNIGTSSEFVEIFHSDIVLNDYIYDFSADFTADTYDLQTVLIHEMGHFLGLQHYTDPFEDSVMYPSVTRTTIYRLPESIDGEILSELYGLSSSSPALLGEGASTSAIPEVGEPVILQYELMPEGKCVHKRNGKIVHEHKVELLHFKN
jgi:hypothetical protein